MILYCDTSALIKRYVEERGTADIDRLWENASVISTSVVAFAETISAFSRKSREGLLTKAEFSRILKKFRADYEHLILVPISGDLNGTIERLARRHSLRGLDLIHLASAMVFAGQKTPKIVFACFDSLLNRAAAKEGIEVAIKI